MIDIRPCTPQDAAAVSAPLGGRGYEVSLEAAAERVPRLNATGSNPTFIACEDSRHHAWLVIRDATANANYAFRPWPRRREPVRRRRPWVLAAPRRRL